MSRIRQRMAALLAAALLLTTAGTSARAEENTSRSDRVVSAALSQIGYTERSDEFTKYGQWYGLPCDYWCAMFLSWSAAQAGVSQSVFPKAAYCPYMVSFFQQRGQFRDSAALGGTYVPQQGDLIFYYKPEDPQEILLAVHVGLVLYVENGTVFSIEGNSLTARLDQQGWQSRLTEYKDRLPDNYVTVNNYPLTFDRILGYGVPAYGDRTALELTGFVDLGNDAALEPVFTALCAEGILSGTSSHTASPRQGLARGDFLNAAARLFGLSGWAEDTQPFSDVPEDSPWYEAAMTFRSAGIVLGNGDNTFSPETYISGAQAQAILSNLLAYLGLPDQTFSFTSGDYACFGDYTTRADIASALYTLRTDSAGAVPFTGTLQSGDAPLDCACLSLNGTTYIPLDQLSSLIPSLAMENPDGQDPDRTLVQAKWLTDGDTGQWVLCFRRDGAWYVPLRTAAELLGGTVGWDGETASITLDLPETH